MSLGYIPLKVDYGWAWAVSFSLFVWNIIIDGTLKIQGILYVEFLELFQQGATKTSLINFTQGIMMLLMAPIGGYMADILSHGQQRAALVAFFVGSTISVAVAGYLPHLTWTIVIYGGMLGCFLGLEDPISLSFLSRYFEKKMTMGFALAFVGCSFGSMLLPIMFTTTTNAYGFRGAMLLFSGVWLQGLLVPSCAWPLSYKTSPRKRRPNQTRTENGNSIEMTIEVVKCENQDDDRNGDVEFKIVNSPNNGNDNASVVLNSDSDSDKSLSKKERCLSVIRDIFGIFRSYTRFFANPHLPFLILSCFLGLFGNYGGFFVIPPLAIELGMSKNDSSFVLIAAGVSELISKLLVGVFVDFLKISKTVMLLTSYAITAVVALIISQLHEPYALYGFGVVLGTFGGTVTGIMIPMIVEVVDDSQKGTASGMLSFFTGLASALGPVILSTISESFGSYRFSLCTVSMAYVLGIGTFFGTPLLVRLCHRHEDEPVYTNDVVT